MPAEWKPDCDVLVMSGLQGGNNPPHVGALR